MTRRGGAILLAGLLLGAAGAAAAGLRLRQAGPLVLAALDRRLPGEVAATRTSLGFWPPLRLTLDGLTATLPAAPAPYLTTRRLVVTIDPLPLVIGRVVASAATLVEPRLSLRLEDGWWGGEPSPRRSGSPPPREPGGRGGPGRSGPGLALPTTVTVEGGRVELVGTGRSAVLDGIAGSIERAPGGLRFVGSLAHPALALTGRLRPVPREGVEVEATVRGLRGPRLAFDGPLALVLRPTGRSALEARLDFTQAELVLPGLLTKARGEPGVLAVGLRADRGLAVQALSLRVGPVQLQGDAHLAPGRLALNVEAEQFPLEALSPEVAGRAVELGGTVAGTVGVVVRDGAPPDLSGRLAVSEGSLRVPGSALPAITGLTGDLSLSPDELRLRRASFRWGRALVRVRARYQLGPSRLAVVAEAAGVDLTLLSALLAQPGRESSASPAPARRPADAAQAPRRDPGLPSLPFQLEGTLRARDGRWGSFVFDELVLRARADGRRWTLPRIALRAAGGETVGSATLDPTTREGRLRLAGARLALATLLRLTASGWPGGGGGLVRGDLALRWRGLSWPEFRRTARGHGVLALENGWLQMPVPERFGGRTITVEELRVPYQVSGATVTIQGLRGRGPVWEISGQGRVEVGGDLAVRFHGRRQGEPVVGMLGGSFARPSLSVVRGSF